MYRQRWCCGNACEWHRFHFVGYVASAMTYAYISSLCILCFLRNLLDITSSAVVHYLRIERRLNTFFNCFRIYREFSHSSSLQHLEDIDSLSRRRVSYLKMRSSFDLCLNIPCLFQFVQSLLLQKFDLISIDVYQKIFMFYSTSPTRLPYSAY